MGVLEIVSPPSQFYPDLTKAKCYKTFFVRNLRILVISWSVLTLASLFQPSLTNTLSMKISVNHGQKKFFITLAPS